MLGNLLKQFFAGRMRRAGAAPAPPASPGNAWLTEALRLQRLGRHEEVVQLARSELGREPDNVDALQLAGAALLARGDTRDGLAFLRRAAALSPESANLQATLAEPGSIASVVRISASASSVRPCSKSAPART